MIQRPTWTVSSMIVPRAEAAVFSCGPSGADFGSLAIDGVVASPLSSEGIAIPDRISWRHVELDNAEPAAAVLHQRPVAVSAEATIGWPLSAAGVLRCDPVAEPS